MLIGDSLNFNFVCLTYGSLHTYEKNTGMLSIVFVYE